MNYEADADDIEAERLAEECLAEVPEAIAWDESERERLETVALGIGYAMVEARQYGATDSDIEEHTVWTVDEATGARQRRDLDERLQALFEYTHALRIEAAMIQGSELSFGRSLTVTERLQVRATVERWGVYRARIHELGIEPEAVLREFDRRANVGGRPVDHLVIETFRAVIENSTQNTSET